MRQDTDLQILPLRFHSMAEGRMLFCDDAGRTFFAGEDFAARYATGTLTQYDISFLQERGFIFRSDKDLEFLGHIRALSDRLARSRQLTYLILVPTLRCDLRCTYCQVSRVNADQKGYDWSEETVTRILDFLSRLDTNRIQIEFQGGEPLLRPDLIKTVMTFCDARFNETNYVICTNLSFIDPEILTLFDHDNVHISTSLDGPETVHQKNRTQSSSVTDTFFRNLQAMIDRYGPSKVSALPTINVLSPPDVSELLDTFTKFGLMSIFLRPVSHHGFARKTHAELRDESETWNAYFDTFLSEIIRRNAASDGDILEEYYFSQVLKRCLQGGVNNHVDLRNPNMYAKDYMLIDFDGRLYPTDEARMLTRTGLVDLSIGSAEDGITEQATLDILNAEAFNNFDPDCVHCAFQPACGVDLIDDIARYGRRDVPRSTTFFCRRQTHLFDRAWQLIVSDNPADRKSLCAWLNIPYTETNLVPQYD